MPTYEYECKTCGTIVEAQQKITDPPLERGAHLVEEEGVVVAFCGQKKAIKVKGRNKGENEDLSLGRLVYAP
jgi:predicted nucleic acid-binding Zn ribbon protein